VTERHDPGHGFARGKRGERAIIEIGIGDSQAG
jgi:hypothetical protein